MTEESPKPSEPIRVDDMSQGRPSTRDAVIRTNPTVAESSTPAGTKDPEQVGAQHKASYEAARQRQQEAEQQFAQPQQASQVRESIAQVASQIPSQSFPEQPVPQSVLNPNLAQPAPPAAPTSSQPIQADLSQLVTKGRIEEEVNLGGFVFRLSTLTSKENAEALDSMTNVNSEIVRMTKLTIAILARAIVTVNGTPLENLYQGQQTLTREQAREEVVGSWQQGLVGELFNHYSDMMERSGAAFGAVRDQDEAAKN